MRLITASYRRIAAQSGVPLGSTTYYFPDVETLIISAFETLRDGLEPLYSALMRDARTETDIVDALVAATSGATSPSFQDIRLYEELHLYGLRSPPVADLLRDFQEESLVFLRRTLPDGAARAIDAPMWGWWSYRAIHPDAALDEGLVRDAYHALVTLSPSSPATSEEPSRV